MVEITAIILCVLLFTLALFQLALILGVPIGRFAWGGAHNVLPTKFRIGSATSIILYAFFAIIIVNQAGMTTWFNSETTGNIAIWILVGYFILGIPMNAISRSKPERNLMTPLVTLLAVLTMIVATS